LVDLCLCFDFIVLFNLFKAISPPGSASLNVLVKNADATFAAGINVKIRLADTSEVALNAVSDANGVALFSGIDAGVYCYIWICTCTGRLC